MAASIRGHMSQFKIYENGALKDIVNAISHSINMDSSMSRSFYVGSPLGEGDQTIEGWSGSTEFEVKGSEIDDFIDALVTNNLAGIGVSDYTFIDTENFPDGTSSSYVYFDMQFKYSKRVGGMNEKTKKTLEWQAAGRKKL